MKICRLTIQEIDDYQSDIADMLRQSFEKSFPNDRYDSMIFYDRIEKLKTYMRADKAIVIGIKEDNHLLGFIWFFEKVIPGGNVIHINHFVVHEKYRALGLGRALIEEVEKHAKRQGVSQIELFVTKDNVDAVRFYEKRDFKIERFVMTKRLW